MSEKTKKTIYWLLTGLVTFIFIGSAYGKLNANTEALEIAEAIGLDAYTYSILGIVELLCVFLFVNPRTGVLGTLLLGAYMGGAIATHLEHGQSIIAPCIIQAFVWAVAFYRFPELKNRLLNK